MFIEDVATFLIRIGLCGIWFKDLRFLRFWLLIGHNSHSLLAWLHPRTYKGFPSQSPCTFSASIVFLLPARTPSGVCGPNVASSTLRFALTHFFKGVFLHGNITNGNGFVEYRLAQIESVRVLMMPIMARIKLFAVFQQQNPSSAAPYFFYIVDRDTF